MEGDNFVLPGTKRVPSMFAAGCLYFLAVAGKLISEYFGAGLEWLLRRLLTNPYEPKPELSFITPLVTLLYYLCFILLPFYLYARKHPGMGEYARLKPPKRSAVLAGVALGIVCFYLCVCANYLWCLLIEALGGAIPYSSSVEMNSTADVITQVACTAVLPAISEELLFRGALLSAFEEKGERRAICIVALLFMLVHSRIAGMPAEYIGGVVLAYLVVLTGSLMTGIICHTVYNAMALWMISLNQSGGQLEGSYYESIGGAIGTAVLLLRAAVYACAIYLIIRYLKKKNSAEPLERPAIEGEPRGVCDWIVMSCAVLLAAVLYVPDILEVVGVLR